MQLLMGMLRPDKDAPKRGIFNYAHRSLGTILLTLSSNNLVSFLNLIKITKFVLFQVATIFLGTTASYGISLGNSGWG
jgi:hypothetical protein